MAIIVDKEKKRRDIAIACSDLLLKHGIRNLSVSQIAQTAGVGKGTIYEYFENKEEIVFEIISIFMSEHQSRLRELAEDSDLNTREKLRIFCGKLYQSEEGRKYLDLYHEFLGISLIHKDPQMLEFNMKVRGEFISILQQIIDQGISNGELDKKLSSSAGLLTIFVNGLMVNSRLRDFDVEKEIEQLLDLLFAIKTDGESS